MVSDRSARFRDFVELLAQKVSPEVWYVNESPLRWIGQAWCLVIMSD